jgi:hypothetical protein
MAGLRWNAYIDESGDRGWTFKPSALGTKAGSSRIFAMTAVLVPAGNEAPALATWDTTTRALGRSSRRSWKETPGHSPRRLMARAVAAAPDVQTISIVLCKAHLPNADRIRDPGSLYHWTFRLMIERLSWFGHDRGDTVAATFAQVRGLKVDRLREYASLLKQSDTYIRWKSIARLDLDNPANRRMLQLADAASGAVFAAFEPDAWGLTEQVYLNALRPAIWRRANREVWKDGLKYGPNPPTCDAEHPWFAEFCKGLAA